MQGDLRKPENWLTLVFAFAVWGGHFMAIYAAALIFPESPMVIRLIVIAATLAAAGLLAGRWFRLGHAGRNRTAMLSMAIATLAIVFQTVPGLLG